MLRHEDASDGRLKLDERVAQDLRANIVQRHVFGKALICVSRDFQIPGHFGGALQGRIMELDGGIVSCIPQQIAAHFMRRRAAPARGAAVQS